jgi:hypothetical protein
MERKGITPPPRVVWQIVLTVRGKKLVKEYYTERDYKRWRDAYEYQMMNTSNGSGITNVEVGKVYR